MATEEQVRVSLGYAVYTPATPEQKERWGHFYQKEWISRLSAVKGEEVVYVEVREDPTGTHFAWWNNECQRFFDLWSSRGLIEMCFAYGSADSERKGLGKVCMVRVIRVEREKEKYA